MIIQQNGRYYIALNQSTGLDDIILYQNGLIELIKIASTAEIYQGAEEIVFHVFRLLEELTLTSEQAEEIERVLNGKVFGQDSSSFA
ncbi:MAG: hypothetical protein LUG51_13430 [Tannerellaceae bacterium]|nr:hypothetical protein [Tannerellaceae bacterium]